MISEKDFEEITKILIKTHSPKVWSKGLTPFEVLVSVILSQATERKGNIRAFKNLKDKFELTPDSVAKADVEKLAECIKPAGLHNNKSAKIKEMSKIIVDEYGGNLKNILDLPEEEARKKLMSLPGVGQKTADVVLNLVSNVPVFPIDTHIERIAKRIALVEIKTGYDGIKATFERLAPPEKRRSLHLALIEHGREFCKKINPKCSVCPIFDYCERRGLNDEIVGVKFLKCSFIDCQY